MPSGAVHPNSPQCRGGGVAWFPCLRRLAPARRLHGM